MLLWGNMFDSWIIRCLFYTRRSKLPHVALDGVPGLVLSVVSLCYNNFVQYSVTFPLNSSKRGKMEISNRFYYIRLPPTKYNWPTQANSGAWAPGNRDALVEVRSFDNW